MSTDVASITLASDSRLESLGVTAEALLGLVERAQRELNAGPLPSVQIAIACDGEILLSATLGNAAASSRYCMYSCIKPMVSAAIWRLIDSNTLDLSQSVSHYLPEFATNGKEVVTLEQVLCHTAGFPHAPMGPRHWWDSATRRQRMAEWRLNWEPGSHFEYHATSGHWVLAELIQEVLQQDFRVALRELVLDPIGLPRLELGVPADRQDDINQVMIVGETPTPEEVEAVLGSAMDLSELGHDILLRYNEPRVLELGVPGAAGVSTAADVTLFYQELLTNSHHLWSADMLHMGCREARVAHLDPSNGVPANRSLGLVIKGNDEQAPRRGMGSTCSPQSFGHNGVGGQVAWCDPQSGVSFCLLGNGLDANPFRAARFGRSMSNRAGALRRNAIGQ